MNIEAGWAVLLAKVIIYAIALYIAKSVVDDGRLDKLADKKIQRYALFAAIVLAAISVVQSMVGIMADFLN